jgi:hypothetical protein
MVFGVVDLASEIGTVTEVPAEIEARRYRNSGTAVEVAKTGDNRPRNTLILYLSVKL